MPEHVIFDGTHVRVLSKMCKTCIFRPGNLMRLQEGRVEEMVAEATAMEGSIPCHTTLDAPKQAVCAGFMAKHSTPLLQIAERMGVVLRVDPKEYENDERDHGEPQGTGHEAHEEVEDQGHGEYKVSYVRKP